MILKNSLIAARRHLKLASERTQPFTHPYHRNYYQSMREAQWDFLQGPNSHEIRMRIEYSSIVSKQLGFEYRYPLLYPKLLEFFLSIPPTQKRQQNQGRYLIRQYLSQYLPDNLFDSYKKREGLGITPSIFEQFKQAYDQGQYKDAFKDLPYANIMPKTNSDMKMIYDIKAFMLHSYLSG